MFNQTNRALSSGCVRVENPFSLAEKILAIEQNDLTRSDLDTLVKREKTKFIELKKIVHVHQTYLTAYVENGQLKMFNDVYDLDNGLYQRLSKLK
jgi:L,D-transpeptidase YcbB